MIRNEAEYQEASQRLAQEFCGLPNIEPASKRPVSAHALYEKYGFLKNPALMSTRVVGL